MTAVVWHSDSTFGNILSPPWSNRFLHAYQSVAVSMLKLQYYPLISEPICHSLRDNGFAANRSFVPRFGLPRSSIDWQMKICLSRWKIAPSLRTLVCKTMQTLHLQLLSSFRSFDKKISIWKENLFLRTITQNKFSRRTFIVLQNASKKKKKVQSVLQTNVHTRHRRISTQMGGGEKRREAWLKLRTIGDVASRAKTNLRDVKILRCVWRDWIIITSYDRENWSKRIFSLAVTRI